MANQYTYNVPFTEEELYDCYVNKQMTQVEIAELYGTTQKVLWLAMKKMGISARTAAKRNQWGVNNSSWKGGRVLCGKAKRQCGERAAFGNGYYYILDPDHPNTTKNGYVAEHIVVATKERGAPLQTDEIVHHINLNKHDNRPENLAITKRKSHAIWHCQLEEIAVSMMQDGLITFDPKYGYKLVK